MKAQKKLSSKTYVAVTIDAKASRRLRQAVEAISESASAMVLAVDAAPPRHR
jgi:hypothetical protein